MSLLRNLGRWRVVPYAAVLVVLALAVWAEAVLDDLPGGYTLFAFAPAIVLALWLVRVLPALQREREARAAAERVATQAHRIAQTASALGQARTSAEAIEASVQEPLHWLAADAAVFLVLSEDGTQMTAARAVGHTFTVGEEFEVDEDGSPFQEALRRLAPVVIKSWDETRPEFLEWSSKVQWRRHAATLILPVVSGRTAIAFLQIDFLSPREFSVDDHEYIHMLCTRIAQAVSRTWWHEAIERARVDAESLKARADAELVERQQTELALRASETRYRALATRTTRLHALTASLSVAASVKAVAQAIVDQARIVVGANEGTLTLVDDEDARFEPGFRATEALHSRRPVFVGSIAESQDKFWRSASDSADRGFASSAALPLMVNNAPAGVLEFHFSAPVNFDDEYQALLVSVAQYCAQALDRARLYEQAQRARADAEAANRLKDEFVSTVSHELRTPLNAILGWASMLRTGAIDSEVVPQAVESIHRNAARQAKLVDDLLDFARLVGGRATLDLENVDAPALIRGIVESVIPLAASSQISIQLADVPPATLHGDVRRLEQVFVNLLGNALKFTPPGGHVMVSGRMAGRFLEIRVADDGIGIEPSFLPHVFDRFRQGDSTTTRNHSGLGLGLSIAKQLVEAHKGSICVESAGAGKGTSFTVSLPTSGRQHDEHRDEAPAVEPRLDGVRVLVVDDEQDTRELIGRALEDRGASISVADSSRQAIEILERGGIDVLLADIAMPDEDGYALIRRIRSAGNHLSSIPAAAVTAHAREDERTRALAAGFHVHVAKPVEPGVLVRTVDHLVHERRAARRSRV